MRKYLLDSNAANLFIYRRCGVYERAIRERKTGAVIGTAIPVVGEVLGGVEYSSSREFNLPIVEGELQLLRIWPYDLTSARTYAIVYATLRRQGITMQPIDRMIAAVGLTLPDCTVVTSDGDFSRVPGLRVENWAI